MPVCAPVCARPCARPEQPLRPGLPRSVSGRGAPRSLLRCTLSVPPGLAGQTGAARPQLRAGWGTRAETGLLLSPVPCQAGPVPGGPQEPLPRGRAPQPPLSCRGARGLGSPRGQRPALCPGHLGTDRAAAGPTPPAAGPRPVLCLSIPGPALRRFPGSSPTCGSAASPALCSGSSGVSFALVLAKHFWGTSAV